MAQGGPPPGGNIIAGAWLRIGQDYYYCRGWRPDGTARLIRMTEPPHGKPAWVLDPAGGPWTQEHVPRRLRAGTGVWLALAALAAVLIPALLSGQDPILWHAAMPVAVAVCLLAAVITQGAHLRPHDDISLREAEAAADQAYAESQQLRARNAYVQQAKAAQETAGWQAAIWGQLAAANQQPGHDGFRSLGQSPPL
jgi:hypothetical protein